MATALDFRALLKAERARARGAPAAPARSDGAVAARPIAPLESSRGAHDDYCLGRPRRALSLEAHRVEHAPACVWHVPSWVTEEEEVALIRCADAAPPGRWTQLRGRRLQNLGGLPRPAGMAPEPLPPWVASVCGALVECGVFPPDAPPNHVLLNEYRPGEGIDAHRDGPLYAPRVAILSLGSHAPFEFLHDEPGRTRAGALLLPPRGLLVFSDDAYERLLHTVPAREVDCAADYGAYLADDFAKLANEFADEPAADDRGATRLRRRRRISLTVRRVLQVMSEEEVDGAPLAKEWETRAALAQWVG